MRCPEASEAISSRLDAPLPREVEAALRAHLDACPQCDLEQRMVEELSELLVGVEMARPAPLFTERVMARVARQRRLASWLRGSVILVLGIVVGLSLTLIPLLSPSSPVASAMARPSLVSSVVGLLVRMAGVAGTLLGALGLLARALFGAPEYVGLVGIVALTTLLMLTWLRIVTRASTRVHHR